MKAKKKLTKKPVVTVVNINNMDFDSFLKEVGVSFNESAPMTVYAYGGDVKSPGDYYSCWACSNGGMNWSGDFD